MVNSDGRHKPRKGPDGQEKKRHRIPAARNGNGKAVGTLGKSMAKPGKKRGLVRLAGH